MKTLYVYENHKSLETEFHRLCKMFPAGRIDLSSKTINYAGNTFYCCSLDNLDHTRGLQYNSWYLMGKWVGDLSTWQRDTLDAHCRGKE